MKIDLQRLQLRSLQFAEGNTCRAQVKAIAGIGFGTKSSGFSNVEQFVVSAGSSGNIFTVLDEELPHPPALLPIWLRTLLVSGPVDEGPVLFLVK